MDALPSQAGNTSSVDELVITEAAIGGFGRLLRAVQGTVQIHPSADGGLICEDRSVRARPRVWRVSPDGAVLPDSPYNFRLGAFITASLPRGL